MGDRKRKHASVSPGNEETIDPADELMFLCLGGGNEVGRSCHIIQYKGKTVMLDAGMHPAYDGLAALPFYDEFDLQTVDVLLISHFHIDHAASLPYVLAKTNFKGRVFMTHATKAIYKWLIQDSVRIGNISSSSSEQKVQLYTEADHLSTFPTIEAIDYYTTHTISSIRITPYPAGHVLGAAMYLIEIAGLKVLFTGDYSREDDRHLIPASIPPDLKVDVLITESTYGISSHMPRPEREAALMRSITGILNRGGRVLMPVFALGRAQELLLILDEYWARHREYQKYPIYYASNLARRCMVVYQTYISSMNDNIKRLFRERMAEAESAGDVGKRGPWDFRFIRSLKSLDRFEDIGGCVMLASPGMMQNGISRQLLERWAPDQRNGVVVTGYSVEGTMAKMILQEPDSIQAVMTRNTTGAGRKTINMAGRENDAVMIPRRCTIQELSFAAHVDGQENRNFIEEVGAPVVILVHGEKGNMMRLKSKLLSMNADKAKPVKVYSPANCEEVRLPFKTEKVAKVVGKLAEVSSTMAVRLKADDGTDDIEQRHVKQEDEDEVQESGDEDGPKSKVKRSQDGPQLLSGVLVQKDFKMSLMAPEDLKEYAGLTTTTVTCRHRLRLASAGFELIRWTLQGTFGHVDVSPLSSAPAQESAEAKSERAGKGSASASTNGTAPGADGGRDEYHKTGAEFTIMEVVTVKWQPDGDMEVVWTGNQFNDGLADGVIAALTTAESSPAAVKYTASGQSYAHCHGHYSEPNPYAALDTDGRLDLLCLLLETQFGDSVTPIRRPRLDLRSETDAAGIDAGSKRTNGEVDVPERGSGSGSGSGSGTGAGRDHAPGDEEDEAALTAEEEKEIARLHALGIPVPGLEVRFDNRVARIWLEKLEVECADAVLKERIKAIVERGVELGRGPG